MPVEAIHLSALQDSLLQSSAAPLLRKPEHLALARLGAVTIDFPYFDRFALGVARYLMKLPTATSAWGNLFHEQHPVLVTKLLLAQARARRQHAAQREAGERLLAFALGYASHIAVDRNMHPMVNRLAKLRAARLSDDWQRQHTEVEKFQSVLFHEQRNGFDFMGRSELRHHIAVEGRALHRDTDLREGYLAALHGAFGKAPERALVQRWAGGYTQYTWLVSSVFGKTLVPDRVKHEVRGEVYEGSDIQFTSAYSEAVAFSRRALDAALSLAEDPRYEASFDELLPDGPIDGS